MHFSELIALIDTPQTKPAPNPTVPDPSAIIGSPVPRIDGPLKTTGTALYAGDYNFPRMVYAVPVCSTIASGKIRSLDASAAEKLPGVLLILQHSNTKGIYRNTPGNGPISEDRPPLSDNTITYYGQYIALAVAETFAQATAAAAAVRVAYDATKPNVSPILDDTLPAIGAPGGPGIESHRGDPDAAFASAPIKIDETYTTPVETHNPMEMHATAAVWKGEKLTLYECSQGVVNHHNVMAQVLGIPRENLQIITRFLGSGFGGKLFPWPHSALCAVAARQLNRPVKLVVTRQMMFQDVGHRPRTMQRMRLSASPEGKLLSLAQDYRNHTSEIQDVRENCGEATPFLYSTANLRVSSALVRRNVGTPTPMRGPGAVPGLFAVESAMDELAIKLKMDPVQLRIGLDTLIDEESGKPFSSRHLKECLQVGSEKFGWSRRTPEVASMRTSGPDGDLILGWGVACASWGAGRGGAQCSVNLLPDGSARVSSGTQDIGTGTYTVIAQAVSDKTGITLDKIDVVLGDSSLPPGPMSGGSTATASVMPAILDGTDAAIKTLLQIAAYTPTSPFAHQKPEDLALTNGHIHQKSQPASSGTPFGEILHTANLAGARGEGKSGGNPNAHKYSMHSFGAQFAEVQWDPGIARLRVSRIVTVIDGGRIINPRTATNQVAGAAVMGVGMALFEQTIYDSRSGAPINSNFADYIVPTSADAPVIDVHFLDIPDPLMGSYGARGIGEIGLAGVAPAITAAVYHATGVRVRNLPVRIEDLLQSHGERKAI
ncbi:MAG: xanthine dehydrogenase family protein molybdopterin-binding subunit [Acidobacteriaceae bacterium]